MGSTSTSTMESQIGRYGTMSLMKQNEANTVVASFGIDSENLTFGRDQNCAVRLYYPDVSPIHCKITFKERKAFLVVLGAQGLLVDGCKVFANSSTSSPKIIPLSNNSEIEIHGKRFRFTYPPKELRAQLFSSPTLPKRRALRLSMIESAEVFSPRPSANPMENLRVLKSPLKSYHIQSRSSSPLKPTPPPARSLFSSAFLANTAGNNEGNQNEEDIILVEGDSPRVVEEEKDLIILEDVELPVAVEPSSPTSMVPAPLGSSPAKLQYIAAPPPLILPPQPPTTPRRSRPTLHKSVLIRSAQRAVLQAELQREEEEEEAEVFGAVLDENDDLDEEDEAHNLMDENESAKADTGDQIGEGPQTTWKASLERIWPFRHSTSPTKSAPGEENGTSLANEEPMDIDSVQPAKTAEEDIKDEEKEVAEYSAPLYPRLNTPVSNRPPRLFNTPRTGPHLSSQRHFSPSPAPASLNYPRKSLGGGEAPRRIKLEEEPWKVQDLVIPTPSSPTKPSETSGSRERTPGINQLSEEERRAIQERRRSAVRMPVSFFPGGTPGMGPPSPVKNTVQTPARDRPSFAGGLNEDEQLNTRSLLEKMKETVEGVKAERRASLATSPQKKTFTELATIADGEEDFSLLRSPMKQAPRFSSVFAEYESVEPQSAGNLVETPTKSVVASGSSATHSDVNITDASNYVKDQAANKTSAMLSPLKTRTARKKVVQENFIETPSLADDEASLDVIRRREEDTETDDEQIMKKPNKVLRGTGRSSAEEPSKKSVKPSSTSNENSNTIVEAPIKIDEVEEQSADVTQLLKPKATRARSRARPKTPNPSDAAEEAGEQGDNVAPLGPLATDTRRITRKTPAEPDTGKTNDGVPTLAKRTRARARSKAPEEFDTESSSKTASMASTRITRTRAKTPSSEIEADDGTTYEVDEEVTIIKTKRGRRPKTAAVSEAIKEEADEQPTTKTTGRANSGTSNSDNLAGAKGRSKKVFVPVSETSEADVNKENTASEDELVVTRTRGGRLRKVPAAKVKEETLTDPEIGLRSGAKTRAMRTRSKT